MRLTGLILPAARLSPRLVLRLSIVTLWLLSSGCTLFTDTDIPTPNASPVDAPTFDGSHDDLDLTPDSPDEVTEDTSDDIADRFELDPDATIVTVDPVYPAFADWNDYLVNDGDTRWGASGLSCQGDELLFSDCLHGGELRIAYLTTESRCDDFVVSDSLNAFRWSCSTINGFVHLRTLGLQQAIGLTDLVNSSGDAWRPIGLTVKRFGVTIAQSQPTIWWNNPVEPVPTDGALDETRTVYVLTEDTTDNLSISSDRVSLVMADGATLTCDSTGGDQALLATSVVFVWVEGSVDASTCRYGVRWLDSAFMVGLHLEIVGAESSVDDPWGAGLYLDSVTSSRIAYSRFDSNSPYNLKLLDSDGNQVENVLVARAGPINEISYGAVIEGNRNQIVDLVAFGNSGHGVAVRGDDNLLVGVRANNNGGVAAFDNYALSIDNGNRNVVIGAILTHNDGNGLDIHNGQNNIILYSTVSNNEGNGLYLHGDGEGTRNHVIMGVAAVGNEIGFDGLEVQQVSVIDFAALRGDGSAPIHLVNGVENAFSGLLKTSAGGTLCDIEGGTSPGLIDVTCSDDGTHGSSLYTGQRSDAVLSLGSDVSETFVGRIHFDDPVNIDDTSGTAPYNTLLDFSGFASRWRGWGRYNPSEDDDFAGPLSSRCSPDDTCRIWEWALLTGDAGDPNGAGVLLNVQPIPSGSDIVTHVWYANSLVECANMSGAVWNAGQSECTGTFLRWVVEELQSDGNGNGLCESGEVCWYAPNLGAYQGHGELDWVSDITTGSAVGNVEIRKYVRNGCGLDYPCETGLSCADFGRCLSVCISFDCVDSCAEDVCEASAVQADELTTCMNESCGAPCANPSNPECHSCTESSCPSQLDACTAATCD